MTASTGDPAALASALATLGFPCRVEPRGALALLSMRADDAARLAASSHRAAALALTKEHGFTHAAVEIGPGAAVLRD